MKLNLFIILSIVTLTNVLGQTSIKDKSVITGTWTKANSPYIIEKEAIIPKGSTLTIEDGVRVEFKTWIEDDYLAIGNGINKFDFDMAFLRIEGTLLANGSVDNPVYFTNNDDEGRSWGNLYFSNSSNSKLTNCIIENSGRIVNIDSDTKYASAAITLYESSIEVNSTIIRTGNYGIELTNSQISISNSVIKDISNFAISAISSNVNMNKSTITNNEWSIALTGEVNVNITNSLFLGNYSDFDSRFLKFGGELKIINSAFEISTLPKIVNSNQNNKFGIKAPFKSDVIGAQL